MEDRNSEKQVDWQQVTEDLKNSKRPPVEKLAYAFGWITDRIIEQGMNDIEVARALRDEDSLIKHQIKTATMRHARRVFQNCHVLATGRKAWDE